MAVTLLAVGLAGCIQPGDGGTVSGEGAEPHGDADWRTMSINMTGEPGEWLFFYHPLPEPVDEVAYDLDVQVRASGDRDAPAALFTSRPSLVLDWDSTDHLDYRMSHVFEAQGPLFVARDGGDLGFDRSGSFSAGVGGGVWTGFSFIVGSNVAWQAQVEIVLQDASGGSVGPSFVSRGEGVSVMADYERSIGVADGALVGQVEWDAQIDEPGWTHIQYDYDALQPIGVREYEFRFPGGDSISGTGQITGYYVPMLGGSASSGGWLDYCATVTSMDGSAASHMTYAQAQSRLEVAGVHLPMNESALPDSFGPVGYCQSGWPFHDPPLIASGVGPTPGSWLRLEQTGGTA